MKRKKKEREIGAIVFTLIEREGKSYSIGLVHHHHHHSPFIHSFIHSVLFEEIKGRVFIGVYLGVEVISRIGVGYGEEARLAIGYFRFIEEREREKKDG